MIRTTEVNNWVLYSAACKHLAAVQKIVDVLIQRDARDELTRLTHRLERLRFRAEPEGGAP
jgi:hypothetical protein